MNGLLRSILYQWVSDQPQLASLLLTSLETVPAWTDARFQKTLKNLIEQTGSSTRILLLIDGLDEFEGDADSQESLLELILNLSKSSHLKVLVSSRPDPPLKKTLSQFKGLRLQDFTLSGIHKYVEGTLLPDGRMDRYQISSPTRVKQLIDNVCSKGDGVFLWGRLAVQDLKAGIRAHDSISMLKQRLEMLNSSLDGLFSQLLNRIHQVHQEPAATLFAIALEWNLTAKTDMTLLHMAFIRHPELGATLQDLLEADEPEKDRIHWCYEQLNDLEIPLVTQSAGLVEVVSQKCSSDDRNLDLSRFSCFKAPTDPLTFLSRICFHFRDHMKVQFVHRSVLDFLTKEKRPQGYMSNATMSLQDRMSVFMRAAQGVLSSKMILSREAIHAVDSQA